MRNKKIFWLFVLLSLTYLVVTYITPVEQSVLLKYGITTGQARMLQLTVTLPIVLIWFVAYYGWNKVQHYAEVIKDTAQGPPTNVLSRGLLFLVLWLPIVSTTGALSKGIYADHQNLTAPLTIITNYLNLIILLIATSLLAKGAYQLKGQANDRQDWRWTKILVVIAVILSFFYVYVTLSNPYRTNAIQNGVAAYYLPDWLLASTIIFPYLVVFYLGFRSVQYLHIYEHAVKGVVYRDAIKYIANGIGVTLLGVLAIRYLVSMTVAFNEASLRFVLAIIYGLLLLIAFGFILIAKGSNRLKKIEEI